MVPAVIPMLLIFIPAILMALGVVREKELGSITNLYVTPVTRLEFLLGKQLPYIVVALISFVLLVVQSQLMFQRADQGQPAGAELRRLALCDRHHRLRPADLDLHQHADRRAVRHGDPDHPAHRQFSGLTTPVAALEGASYWIGQFFPASYFLIVSRGTFTKALGFADLWPQFIALACFIPVLTLLSVALLRKQEK